MNSNELKPGTWVQHKIWGKAWLIGYGTGGMAVLEDGLGNTLLSYPENLIPCIEPRKPVRVSGWVNVYEGGKFYPYFFNTRELADKYANEYRLACVHVSGVEDEEPK